MDEQSLDRFRMTHSVLDDLDDNGNGTRVVYEDGLWRAFRMKKGKPDGRSSGGWNTMEEALTALRKNRMNTTNSGS
jgi:hypothetical protein